MQDITFMVDAGSNPVALLGEERLPSEITWQVSFNLSPELPARVMFFVKQEISERADIKEWREKLRAAKLPNAEWCELLPNKVG